MKDIFEELKAPFPPERIHWRIGSKTKDGTKARVLAYLNARDVMERLDEVVGPNGWEDSYYETSKRLICTLTLFLPDGPPVSKSDGAGDTNMEGEKGGISDAFKRAAVKWGIGRYLYECEAPWVPLDDRGNIPRDFDGAKYLPKPTDYMKLVRNEWDAITAIKGHLANNEVEDARAVFKEWDKSIQMSIWKSPTAGGCFTTEERAKLKGTN